MDFTLDQKHEMARDLFKQFAETEVKPLAQETDETEVFPAETVAKMGKYGFMGIPVPKEYGGQGCDPLTYVMCVEELSKVCGTTGVIVSAHTSLCIDPIMTFGTEEQKKKYVPDLASGKKIGAFGLTEPGAGTDAQGCQTKAVLDGDEWVLNGSKCFITNGKVADVYIIIAITSITEDKRGRKKKNFSAFIVDKGTPGFSFGTKEKKMGIRGSSTYELIFEDARIPKDALLGKEGRGFPIAMHTLDGGRIGIAAQALGIAEGALERTIEYTKERKQFGRSIAQQQNTQFKLADMATRIDAAKYLVYAAAVLDGDEWVLNGSKCFITNGKVADVYIIIAITSITEDKRGRKKKNFSAFIVDKGTPGFSFGTKEKKMGIRGSSTYELIFEDARIPKDALLGKEGRGFPIAMHTLDGGRIGIAAQALGIAEGALERTIEYTKERKQFGRSIAQQQNTQFKLADMATRIDAAKYLVYAAAMKKAEFAKNPKVSYSVDAAKAKLFAAETAMAVTTECVQLFGGYGYIREYDVERMMRDAKITEIYEGTSEVQRMVISGSLLR